MASAFDQQISTKFINWYPITPININPAQLTFTQHGAKRTWDKIDPFILGSNILISLV